MSSLKRKRNLLDDKHKREIISYAKENPELIQQQIADNLTIKWDLFIRMSLYNCKMYVSRVETI
jgi:ABC-type iron transport system FetAB ATPase subunit